jgi:hypothetical protein
MTDQSRTIDYINYDFDALKNDILKQLSETDVYKDVNIAGSNINNITDLISYIGSLNGYYINSAANENFLPTAKRYNNLNKIGQLLRYDARGVVSSEVDVVGSITPEYVYGKQGEYIEIPAYSLFPSTKPTTSNKNFIFTNPTPIIYITKGFGVKKVEQTDIKYKGYNLPFTAPLSFFQSVSGGPAIIDPVFITMPLSLNKPLNIINRNTPDNYRGFDLDAYPAEDSSDSTSVGQPFINTIECLPCSFTMVESTDYPLLMKFDIGSSTPNLEIITNSLILSDRVDDIIGNISLELVDSINNTYKVSMNQVTTDKRFYIGKTGMDNLSSVDVTYTTIPGRGQAVEQINLAINSNGNSSPFTILINGSYYTFTNGTISTPKFKENFFDSGIEVYNVILTINDSTKPELNYLATLDVTTKEPISNQAIVAKIYTGNTDSETNVKSLQTSSGAKYGNLQVTEKITYKTTNQKIGRVYFSTGQQTQQVLFNSVFVPGENETTAKYQVQLSSDGNVRKWIADEFNGGFKIFIEPDTEFSGYIDWVATQIIQNKTKSIPVKFDKPLPQSVTIDGNISNYMVQLTPNSNVEVWYENLTTNGFDIKTERDFEGKVSWSVYNFYDDQSTPYDVESTYRQSNKVSISNSQDSIEVNLDIPFYDDRYAIQLVPNNNIGVWYTAKTTKSFIINKEPDVGDTELVVDWYVDGSDTYQFQRHGEVDFSGRTVISQDIPGFRFVDIPETFNISKLIQGTVGFTYVNVNNVIDNSNNFLNLAIDPTKLYEKSISFIVKNSNISTNSIRIFAKNEFGKWDEWTRVGTGYDEPDGVGNKVFRVFVNHDKLTKIEFGDGINWGSSINNKEIFMIGLDSVGSDGNIGKNIISPEVIVSQYILGNDKTDIEFEKSLVSVIGLKSKVYFSGKSIDTSIIDSENTKISNNDLKIYQNQLASGGANVETVDEIRANISNTFTRQNRNVSQNDLSRYIIEVFSNYIVKCKVLNYDELIKSNIIPKSEQEKYWFNNVFVIGLNKDGSNTISKNLRDVIVNKLNGSKLKMIGKEHEILPASWIPIDILIRYSKQKTANASLIENDMKKNILDYFQTSNHELGDRIPHSDMVAAVNVDGVTEVEVMMNKDPDNKFKASDYIVDIRGTSSDSSVLQRNKLMELIKKDPSLVKIFQPLFSTTNTAGITEWNYSLDIQLETYEFPKLGDIIIQRAN